MRRILNIVRRGRDPEKGAALPFVAMMLLVLLGMAAFAVDLGWLYLQGSRVQRAADSAALAGVVHLPANTAGVNTQTVNGANANGWDVGEVNGVPIVGGGSDVLNWQPLSDNRLEVRLEATVPTFFMKVFGINEMNISRRATAEYIKPVPMGSPSACFGLGQFAVSGSVPSGHSLADQGLGHCAAYEMNFWAAINGPYTPKEQGDPFSPRCLTVNSGATACNPASATNPQFRSTGYYYGVEIPEGKTSFTVKIFDAAFYDRNCQIETGDCIGAGAGVTTHYTLYRPDETPLDPTDNSNTVCSTSTFGSGHTPTTRNRWTSICTLNGTPQVPPGIYVLNVRTTGGGGNNSYAVGVTTVPAAPHARTYAINDMSIFTNSGGEAVATVYLAEVEEAHAGKSLQLDFFDPGENPTGDAWVEVRTPTNGTATCSWVSRNEAGTVTNDADDINPCRIRSTIGGVAQFNGQWLNMGIGIPNSYTCATTPTGPNCFWTMRLELGSTSQDRTTWAARVIGNPVRLTPDDD